MELILPTEMMVLLISDDDGQGSGAIWKPRVNAAGYKSGPFDHA